MSNEVNYVWENEHVTWRKMLWVIQSITASLLVRGEERSVGERRQVSTNGFEPDSRSIQPESWQPQPMQKLLNKKSLESRYAVSPLFPLEVFMFVCGKGLGEGAVFISLHASVSRKVLIIGVYF